MSEIDKVKEFCLCSFLERDVFIKKTKSTDEYSDFYFGKDYGNWCQLRLGCDICSVSSSGHLNINYDILKEDHQEEGEYFLLNDVRIVDEDPGNNTEYHMPTYWECSDTNHFPELFKLYQQFYKLRDDNPTHYDNILHCPTYEKFGLEYNRTIVTGPFWEFPMDRSVSYEEFVSKNGVPEYVSVCGKCHIYMQIFRPEIPFVFTHPLKYFWHTFYDEFSHSFTFKNIEDKNYIETYVFRGQSHYF